jgi:predicted alpha/beta superfamily hydrolase
MRIILLICLASLLVRAQQSVEITFKIKANNIPDTGKVYISGNKPELGNWQPGEISLINTSGNIWERTFSFPAGESIECKITLGSWDREALNTDGSVPKNIRFRAYTDTVISLTINNWKEVKGNTSMFKGQVTGHLDYIRNLKGDGLPPRDIIVWLPPDYSKDTTKRYPVLYMQDGQNLFDPATSAFGIDWQLDETADSLIRQGRMKPIIIVGITNTLWRKSEYAESDTGIAYMNFVVGKIKPLIDSAYRTLTGPLNTAVGGSSLGGLISFMLAWNYPDIFSMAMCVSPALKIYNYDYVDNVESYTGPQKDLKFYFDMGMHSKDSLLVSGVNAMIKVLVDKGYEIGKDIMLYEDEHGEHNEISWAARVWRPLLFFFGKN